MAGKKSVNFIKPSEPSFLKKFKKEIGFKEGPTLETKKALLEGLEDFDDRPEEQDEKPVIVMPENSKISQEEVDDFIKEKERGDGKIVFKKPTKRKNDESEMNSTTKKKKDKKDKDKSKIKKVKNNSLLSFGEDEDEES